MIVLFGDSHTRSYKIADSVALRIFLAQGRKNNFSNFYYSTLTLCRYLNSARLFKSSGLRLAFIIGEPDVRFMCYEKWNIDKSPEKILFSKLSLEMRPEKLEAVLKRFSLFLKITAIFKLKPDIVLGAGSPNPEIFAECLRFNNQLKSICDSSKVKFFSPQSHVIKENKVEKKFIGYSVFKPEIQDHTHLSTEISYCLDKFLFDECVLHKIKLSEIERWKKYIRFHKKFDEINDFKTYKRRDFMLIYYVKRIKRLLK